MVPGLGFEPWLRNEKARLPIRQPGFLMGAVQAAST